MLRLRPEATAALIEAILRGDGCEAEESRIVADHLVEASLSGHDSHGVIRIVRYHRWLRDGTLAPRRRLREIARGGAFVQFDGENGLGQALARAATEAGIELARREGVGVVALRRAGHLGRAGAYAEQANACGLVSVHFVTVAGSRLVAPFGSAERRASTAPVAVGVPHPERREDDFVLDFSTARVAEGKALVAAQGGKALPPDALMAPDGAPTGDPAVLYGDTLDHSAPDPRAGPGALRAMGEHKGSGLMLACELLAGALTGAGTNAVGGRSFGNGMLSVLIDPARFDDLGGFGAEVAGFVDSIRGARPARGVARVMIPGDPERAARAERREAGLPLGPAAFEAMLAAAAEAGAEASPEALVLAQEPGAAPADRTMPLQP